MKKVNQNSQSSKAMRVLSLAIGLGIIAVVAYGLQSVKLSLFFSVASVGLGVAGASTLTGGVLGFLFGIPRTLQHENSAADIKGEEKSFDYQPNTNLEQISDWLTKMLVGVGLTQLTSLPEHLVNLSTYFAEGLGNRTSDPVFVLTLLIYFSIIGFLFGYLWTRLYLAGALHQADLKMIGTLENRVEQTGRKIDEMKKQSELDGEALNVTYKQLNPDRDIPDISQEELNTIITNASRPIRAQIFNQARVIRRKNWRENKPLMELTIPIFKALVKSDRDNLYHMNHGQLGFALKDQRKPNWEKAKSELSAAIEIRGSWQTHKWLHYELNRAFSLIMTDKAFSRNEPSETSIRDAIITDLQAACHSSLEKRIRDDKLIKKWMAVNKINETDLIKSDDNCS